MTERTEKQLRIIKTLDELTDAFYEKKWALYEQHIKALASHYPGEIWIHKDGYGLVKFEITGDDESPFNYRTSIGEYVSVSREDYDFIIYELSDGEVYKTNKRQKNGLVPYQLVK